MKNLLRILLIASMAMILSACAFGNKHSYHDVFANLESKGTLVVALTSHDQRDYVLSENKDPVFVGIQRGGYGNPFDVLTESGNPLAHDITESVSNSLSKNGFKVIQVASSHSDDRLSLINKLKEMDADRLLIFTIYEWKSDTYQNTALIYNLNAEIMDSEGKILGKAEVRGRDDLRGSFLNPAGHAKEVIPVAFREKIEMLINSEQISDAL